MLLRSVFSEALRNIRTATGSPLVCFFLLSALLTGAALLDVGSVSTIMNNAREFREAGASTLIGQAKSVDATKCEALNEVDNVSGAGALVERGTVRTERMPHAKLPFFEVSPGLIRVLEMTPTGSGVYLSDSMAESLGVREGSVLSIDGKQTRVAGIYRFPQDGRNDRLSYGIISPVNPSTTSFNECWLSSWPPRPDNKRLIMFTLKATAGDENPPSISQLNSRLGETFKGNTLFAERWTRWSPGIAAMGAGVLGYAAIRLRRLEFASALHAGVPRNSAISQALVEAFTWGLPGALAALSALVLLAARWQPQDSAALVLLGSRSISLGLVSLLIGTVLAIMRMDERALRRYFAEH